VERWVSASRVTHRVCPNPKPTGCAVKQSVKASPAKWLKKNQSRLKNLNLNLNQRLSLSLSQSPSLNQRLSQSLSQSLSLSLSLNSQLAKKK